MRKLITSKRIFYFSYFVLLLGISVYAYANSTGMTGKTKRDGGEGCFCHGPSPSPNVNVVINGPDTVETGATANFSVTITGGPLVRGGTNIAALSGEINTLDNSLQKIGDELTHTSPKIPVSNTVTFNFSYTAPGSPGVDTLYANGNSVNFDFNTTGDQWNFANNKPIIVDNKTNISGNSEIVNSFKLLQNYPNPFNPATVIRYSVPVYGNVTLKIFNMAGEEVATLINGMVNVGQHEISWDASGMPSGVYFYKLESKDFSDTKKMMLLK